LRASERLIAALRATGRTVETPVTGSVLVDGEEVSSEAWDRLVQAWDGTEDGLEDLGWELREDEDR